MKLTPITDRYPEDGDICIITDGENYQLAHYFEQAFDPHTGETTENVFVNRIVIGFGWVGDVTKWMPMRNFVDMLKK